MAIDYASNKFSLNFRKTKFNHQLKLLKILDEEFYYRGKLEIEEILQKYPY